jgi:hypothetical protein
MKGSLRKLWQSLPTFAAGASLGVLATWLLTRRPHDDPRPETGADEQESTEPRVRLRDALSGDAAARGGRERRPRDSESALNLEGLKADIASIPGCDQVHLRDLGGGIVEALGAAPDSDTVHLVLTSLRAARGVTVVVNRIWTPASARERKPDLSHIPRVRRDTSVN